MSRHRRTPRVTIEDLFAEMGPDLRASILESLRTIDRVCHKREMKNSDVFHRTMNMTVPPPKEEKFCD